MKRVLKRRLLGLTCERCGGWGHIMEKLPEDKHLYYACEDCSGTGLLPIPPSEVGLK